MIIDHNSNMVNYTDNPPAYEYVAGSNDDVPGPTPADKNQPKPLAQPAPSIPPIVGLHPAPAPAPVLAQPRVYHYQNPMTGEQLVSLLPPDHPEMVCLQQGGHVSHTKFGILGILAAVIWFPLGIGLCLLDRRVTCSRCGVVIDDSVCG